VNERKYAFTHEDLLMTIESLISYLDYDLHKAIKYPEGGGESGYPELLETFVMAAWEPDL